LDFLYVHDLFPFLFERGFTGELAGFGFRGIRMNFRNELRKKGYNDANCKFGRNNMMVQVSLEEAKSKLSDLVNAALLGEKVIIHKDDTHQIQMLPLISNRPTPQFGSAKGLIEIDRDFDAPLADFDEYIQ